MSTSLFKKEIEKRLLEVSREKEMLETKNKSKKDLSLRERIDHLAFKVTYLKDQLKFL